MSKVRSGRRPWLTLCSQTQSVQDQHLPRILSQVHRRKTDFALSFAPEHRGIALLRQQALDLGLPLSHMSDSFTRTVPVAHPVEVKTAGGNAEEAQLQLAVFHAATLSFLASLNAGSVESTSDNLELQPSLGWAVVGHTWSVYIAWQDADGIVRIRSPTLSRPMGTTSFLDLFTLLSVLREGFSWLRDDYWSRYSQRLSAHLDNIQSTPA